MSARVVCAHRAALGAHLDPCSECSGNEPVIVGDWRLTAPLPDIHEQSEHADCSLGGALLRVADRSIMVPTVLAADEDNVAVLAGDYPVFAHEVDPGAWQLSTRPDDAGEDWHQIGAHTMTLFNECGPTQFVVGRQTQVLLTAADLRESLRTDVLHGLSADPKWLPPKYFYDDRGSELFDAITRLPEYYPTRAERDLLKAHAGDIAAAADAEALLELGSGSSEKTRWLLEAMTAQGGLTSYVAVDVSGGALQSAEENLRGLPVRMYPVVADFERHLDALPRPGRRLMAFLGGTIGNFEPTQRARFLRSVADVLTQGETFLVGADLVKDSGRLVRAYDDAAGVTAAFNRNVLRVLNSELDATFDPADFDHVALWNETDEWIEMRLRAREPMSVVLGDLDLTVNLAKGEEIRTEISAKFRPDRLERELVAAGLEPIGRWTDGDYVLMHARA